MFYLGLVLVHLPLGLEPGVPSDPTIGSDDVVTTQVMVAADPAKVRAALADPVQAARYSPDVLSARVVERGACDLVEVTTRGVSDPLTYLVKRCPNGSGGFTESLVKSDDFSRVNVEWKLVPVNGGTQVTVAILTEPNIPVPQRLISMATAKSAVTTLKNLVRRIAGQ